MKLLFGFFLLHVSLFAYSQKGANAVITVNERDSLTFSELNSLAEGSELFFVFVFDNDKYWDCRMNVLDSLKKNERYNIQYQGVKLVRSSEGRKNQFIFGEIAEPNTFFVYSKHRAVTITMDQVFMPFKNYTNWYTIDLGICENNECLKVERNVVGKIDQLKKRYKEIFDAIEINGMVASCLTRMDSLEREIEALKYQSEDRPDLLVGLNCSQNFTLGKYSSVSDYTLGEVNVDITSRPEFGLELISLRRSSWEKLKFYFSLGISRSKSDISFRGDSLLFVIHDPALDSGFTRFRSKNIAENYYLKSYSIPALIGGYTNIGKKSSLLFGLGLRFSKSYAGGFSEYSHRENNFILNQNSNLVLENVPSLGLNSYSSNTPSYNFSQTSWYSYQANVQYLCKMEKCFLAVSFNYERNATFLGAKNLTSDSLDDSSDFYTPDFQSRVKHSFSVQGKIGLNINK
jgi:hypothetical protein